MNNNIYFSIKRPDVVHETIDGETVIVNLESGTYYSLRHSGVDIWDLIEGGITYNQAVEKLKNKFNGDDQLIKKEIKALMIMFQQEDLVKVSVEKPPFSASSTKVNTEISEKKEFLNPLFEKYTDMQQLLLLDPVHEVSDEGWPNESEEMLDGKE